MEMGWGGHNFALCWITNHGAGLVTLVSKKMEKLALAASVYLELYDMFERNS